MKKRLTSIITSLALLFGFVAFTAVPVGAAPVDVFKGDACKGNTSVCGNSGSSIFKVVNNVINVLLLAAGIIAVIMIIFGGISYTLSAGDNAKVTSAKNTILYAVIGLVVAALAFAIVNFIVARLF